ncbi:hypothetical protein EI555_015657, partial [Monodon monoceros]
GHRGVQHPVGAGLCIPCSETFSAWLMVMLAAEQPWRRCSCLQASQRSWGGPRRRRPHPGKIWVAPALSSEQALDSEPPRGEGLADTYPVRARPREDACLLPWSRAVLLGSSAFIVWLLHTPKRQDPIQQARYSRLGVLPSVNWRDSPKKPVLSAHDSMMFGHSRTIKILPPGRKFTLLRSPPERAVKVRKPVPSSHLPLPCPKESEVKVQEEPQRGMAKMEDHTETKGEDDWKRHHRSSGDIPLTSRPQEASGVLTSL